MWVETHPDAIKSIWLEQRDVHEDFDFDWDKPSGIRLMVIGPSFKSSVPRLANRIGYPLELVEYKKFSDGEREYISIPNSGTCHNTPPECLIKMSQGRIRRLDKLNQKA